MRYKLHNFGQNCSKLFICPKRGFFGEIDSSYFCPPSALHHAKKFQKILRADHHIQGCIILG